MTTIMTDTMIDEEYLKRTGYSVKLVTIAGFAMLVGIVLAGVSYWTWTTSHQDAIDNALQLIGTSYSCPTGWELFVVKSVTTHAWIGRCGK